MRRYQGPDMPLLAHMLNLREPAFDQEQQQDVSQPSPSPVVTPHPSPDPMPSPPRQSSPPPIPFGPVPTSGVVSTDPIPDIPSSSEPSEPKLESKLKTKKRKLVLSDSKNKEEERQSKELDALLDLANAALYEPSLSTTPSKPANPDYSSEQEISPTTLDVVLILSQSKARATTIIY
nr:hypothetical protein [Tanacetum cinerariifolium]